MTVVAFDSKSIASDSLVTGTDGHIYGKAKKLFRLKSGGILGTAGDVDCRALMALLDGVKDYDDLPSKQELEATRTEFTGLLWLPNKKMVEIGITADQEARFFAYVMEINERYAAIGHGEQYARAILSSGGSSKDAVKAAIRHSSACGGPIQEMKLGDMPKPPPKPKNLQQSKSKKKQVSEEIHVTVEE